MLAIKLLFSFLLVTQVYAEEDSASEPMFDWSKHQGEKEVDHPLSEKGLIRITKDKTYVYKTEVSDQKKAMSVKIGFLDPTELENPEQAGQRGATFEENYNETSNPAVLIDYEYQLMQNALGKFGVKAGSGVFVAQGNGHFVTDTNANNPNYDGPREVFTFIAFPTSIGAVYRAQFWHKQLLVPYGEGGGTMFGFTELRDDDKGPKFGGALAAYFAGGIAFNLTYFDTVSLIQLDRDYGINAVYLTAEYRSIIGLSDKYDFTSDFINGGFTLEF